MKTAKQSVFLFIGMSLMLIFSYIGFMLLRDIRDTVFIRNVGAELIPQLKSIASLVAILAGLLFIWISWDGRIDRAFKVFFPLNTVFYAIFAWITLEHPTLLKQPYIAETFYIWSSTAMLLSVTFVWGYANQHYTFKTAALQYPLFAFILIFAVLYSGLFMVKTMTSEHGQSIICATIACSSLLTFIVYLIWNRADWGALEKGLKVSWVYWLAIGAIVFGASFSKPFQDILFKTQLKTLFTDIQSYSAAISELSILKGVFEQAVGLVGIILGLWLYFKGPKSLAKIGALIVIFMGLCGLAVIQNDLWSKDVQEQYLTSAIGFTLFGSLSSLLFRFIKELAYFGIELDKRFTAKIVVDVIIYSLPASFASYLIAETNATMLWFMLGMTLCLFGVIRLHKDLKNLNPV